MGMTIAVFSMSLLSLANKVLNVPIAWSEQCPGDSCEDLLAFDTASLLVSTVYNHVQLNHHQL